MARTVNYQKKAEKIKDQIDALVQELVAVKADTQTEKKTLKVSEIDFENEDLSVLLQIQARLARVILEKSK